MIKKDFILEILKFISGYLLFLYTLFAIFFLYPIISDYLKPYTDSGFAMMLVVPLLGLFFVVPTFATPIAISFWGEILEAPRIIIANLLICSLFVLGLSISFEKEQFYFLDVLFFSQLWVIGSEIDESAGINLIVGILVILLLLGNFYALANSIILLYLIISSILILIRIWEVV